jgi:hypothetical protein
MGIFDKIIPGTSRNNSEFTSESSAFYCILMALGDNGEEIGDFELEFIVKIASIKPVLRSMSASDAIREYYWLKNTYSPVQIIELAIKLLSDENKKAALIISIDLAYSSHHIDNREKSLLESLAKFSGLSDEFIDSTTEAMRLKYM